MEKSPGEVVTIVDREAEELITCGLRGVLDAPVVGEEAAAADPRLIDALTEAPTAWLVDPLDGTANFVAGSPDYAVMAALVHHGHTVASWILRPADDRVYVAERGAGAWRDSIRLSREPASLDPAELRGAVDSCLPRPRHVWRSRHPGSPPWNPARSVQASTIRDWSTENSTSLCSTALRHAISISCHSDRCGRHLLGPPLRRRPGAVPRTRWLDVAGGLGEVQQVATTMVNAEMRRW
ncbi:inositol monophosphatase family protein [Nonomuraea recticatena]|uniref:Inositol monophosphatase n=1 Tax=Nonomuraea recticatena TaxID=46178 RepID=A0ABP6EPE4_9ACTN